MEHRETSKLNPNPANPRGVVVVDDDLRELAASIKEQGILQPLLVTPTNTIIVGHRRAKAAELIALRSVPVIVKDLSEAQQLQVMLVENFQRADLNVVQEGKALLALEGHGLTLSQISKAVGIAIPTIKDRVAIASLPVECHEAFATRALPVGCISVLTPLPKDKQIYWVTRAVKERMRGNELMSAIRRAANGSVKVVIPTDDEIRLTKIMLCVDRIERIDKELDEFPDMRPIQALLRQACTQIFQSESAKRKADNKASGKFKVFDPSSSTLSNETI